MTAAIAHISDTSLWIAAYRARETARPDAAFRDPWAAALAGERGMRFAAETKRGEAMALAMTLRTVAIDRLVEHAIARGVDTVIDLGAGLDTRPYRMALPAELRWVEVDFPHLLAYKAEILAPHTPVCRLERIPADLSVEAERRALFARLGAETKAALVVTEGVIGYLTREQAASLATDLHAIPTFRYWVEDYRRGGLRFVRHLRKQLASTPLRFDVDDPIAFFCALGWRVAEDRHILDEMDGIGRPFPYLVWRLLLRWPALRAYANTRFGYVMYERAG